MQHPLGSSTLRRSSTKKDTPQTLPDFASNDEYMKYMTSVSELPEGFAVGTAKGTFVSEEAPNLGNLPIKATVIHLPDGPTENWAAVFTTNKVCIFLTQCCLLHLLDSTLTMPLFLQFPGAPVLVGRSRVKSNGPLQAIVVNNKVSNVCSGTDGVADAELVCKSVADGLKLPGGRATVLPSSTGVIGWRLPAKELAQDIVLRAIESMQSESALPAAEAICTTDRYPKVRSKTLSNGSRLVGIAKGAGMIEPNMATMLSYIMTDATVPKANLREMLTDVASSSFNSISVDGDESTSDTLVAIASNKKGPVDDAEFKAALTEVCRGLAADVVRNGEGTGHVMKVVVSNFPGTDLEARRLGRHIVNSPLFKCAVAGNDPNTGRLAGAIGSYMGKFATSASVSDLTLALGGREIFSRGKFVLEGEAIEKELSQHMKDAQYNEHSDYPPHQRFVDISVSFGSGSGSATVFGSDLTAEYVAVNADYRS